MSGRRARNLFSTSLTLCVTTLSAMEARAEPPSHLMGSTWSQEAREGVAEPSESPELRAMRLAEEELFGRGPESAPDVFDPDCVYGAPDALSSDVPPASIERANGRAEDLAFLSDLALPSLPVRWDSRVIDYLTFFKNDKRGRDLASAWLKRMERYGPMIRRVLAEHSLPQDLQIVAMVESGYDPLARSQADALGMWQFVKQSGQFYGLRIDHWVDERLDPERATYAAARYLRDLYDRFGSWDLTFAAYNMGYGGLLRALRKFNTNDYWLLSHLEAGLPFETSIYVAKITAMSIVANNPERFGFGDLAREPTVDRLAVDVPEGTPLRPIASAAGMDVEQLKALNPHLRRGRVPPGEPRAQVYIPRELYTRFAQRWSKNHDPALHVGYVVRFGETLEDVARRFQISPSRLRDINELAADAQVRAGFPMLVPATGEITTVNGQQLVAVVPDKEFRYENRRRIFYRAAGRDTPESVARFFDVTVDELVAWNNIVEHGALQRDLLLQLFVRPDLDLGRAVVFTPDQVRVLTLGSDEFFDFHEAQRGRVRVRYRVQPGDTVAKIGEKFELSAGSVGRINQFVTNKELKVDDWIVVYVPEKQLPELEKKGLVARIGSTKPVEVVPATPEPTPPTATATAPALVAPVTAAELQPSTEDGEERTEQEAPLPPAEEPNEDEDAAGEPPALPPALPPAAEEPPPVSSPSP